MRTEFNRGGPREMSGRLSLLSIAEASSGEVEYLEVESPAFDHDQTIPSKHAADGDNVSPAVKWSEGPDPTQTYALIMEDPDAPKEMPFVHWLVYNIPGHVHHLDEDCGEHPVLQTPLEAVQGLNDSGGIGYFGPRPPEGDPVHHYHFQVFALDQILPLKSAASRKDLVEAMRGHVLATGSCTGTYQR